MLPPLLSASLLFAVACRRQQCYTVLPVILSVFFLAHFLKTCRLEFSSTPLSVSQKVAEYGALIQRKQQEVKAAASVVDRADLLSRSPGAHLHLSPDSR